MQLEPQLMLFRETIQAKLINAKRELEAATHGSSLNYMWQGQHDAFKQLLDILEKI